MLCVNLRARLPVPLDFSSPKNFAHFDTLQLGTDRPLRRCCDCFKFISSGPLPALIRLGFLVGDLALQQKCSPSGWLTRHTTLN